MEIEFCSGLDESELLNEAKNRGHFRDQRSQIKFKKIQFELWKKIAVNVCDSTLKPVNSENERKFCFLHFSQILQYTLCFGISF